MYLGIWRQPTTPSLVKSTTYETSTRQNRAHVPWNCQSQVRGRELAARTSLALAHPGEIRAERGRLVVFLAGFSMDAGQEISEHRAPFVTTVHILDGRLRFGVDSEEREMAPQDWLVMPPDAPHRLTALEPTRFVLTLFKRG